MDIGIIGLPGSGKTTLLNALTRAQAQTGGYAAASRPNLGVLKVPDPRLDTLTVLMKSARTVQAEISFVDIPGQPPGMGRSQGFQGEYLLQVSQADALLLVLRAFRSPTQPEPEPDPARDLESLEMELTFADLEIIERRLQKLEASAKAARVIERERIAREAAIMAELKAALEAGTPLRALDLSSEARRAIASFTFLTTKPLLLALNIGEEDLPQAEALVQRWQSQSRSGHYPCLALCSRLEEELAQLNPDEAQEFRISLGAPPSPAGALIRAAQQAAGLLTFFTTGTDESRAWTVPAGSAAPQAAGRIHSDMERGFIRAEVIAYEDLIEAKSFAEARRRGTLRQEGKGYIVQEGDVLDILFNVSATERRQA
jgi:hypothetical protein